METNFSSERSEARQASSNIVDSLLFEAIDQVDMEADYRDHFLDFFERVVESEPDFSPGLSSEVIQPVPVLCWPLAAKSFIFEYSGSKHSQHSY